MGAGASVGVGAAFAAANEAELLPVVAAICQDRQKLRMLLKLLAQSLYDAGDNQTLENLMADRAREVAYEDRLRILFEECDVDNNGEMSLEELKEVMSRDRDIARAFGMPEILHVADDAGVAKLFQEMDTDDSGQISWEEFYKLMLSRRNIDPHAIRRRSSMLIQTEIQTRTTGLMRQRSPTSAALELVPGVDVRSRRIDYWELDQQAENSIVVQTLQELGVSTEIAVSSRVLSNFVNGIKGNYRDVPYHNFQHGMAVLHLTFMLVTMAGVNRGLTSIDLFALAVSALCHDCDHRGRNAAFEIQTLSELALRYNDRSPLENHHCAITFEVALEGGMDGENNIFRDLGTEAFHRVRQRMVAAILGTDMKFHSNHVKKIAHMKSTEDVHEDREFTLELFLHMADIGSSMTDLDISERWVGRLSEEFTAQAKEEERLGLPITPIMAGLDDPKVVAKSQVGFLDFVVFPLATPVFSIYSQLEELKKNLVDSRDSYKQKASV